MKVITNERKGGTFHKEQYTKQKLPPEMLQGTLKRCVVAGYQSLPLSFCLFYPQRQEIVKQFVF